MNIPEKKEEARIAANHLTAPGAKPIIVSLDTETKPMGFEHFLPRGHRGDAYSIVQSADVRNVNYYARYKNPSLIRRILGKEDFLNAGGSTYVLSPIDKSNKYSERLEVCTSLVVAGTDRETGDNISFMTHQNPAQFLHDKKDKFVSDLNKKLTTLKKRCVPGSIDAVIVGGNYVDSPSSQNEKFNYKKNYLSSISLLSGEVKRVVGFEPVVVNGPKTQARLEDDAYYDNNERRLYFVRPRGQINSETRDFTKSDLEEGADLLKKVA